MRITRTAVAATLGAALLGLVLSGCSVAVKDPQPAASKPAASSEKPDPADETEKDAPEDTAVEESTADGSLSAENAEEREKLIGLATTTMPCPDADAPLAQHGSIIRVEGHCATLTIDLDAGFVIADDVDKLVLNGDGSVVYAGKIGELTVTGDVNTLFWTGSAPKLDDTGAGNTLTRG